MSAQRYRIRWNEISTHETELSAEELAELMDCDVEDLELEDWSGLENDLAKLDDDGFEFLERHNIEVEAIR